MRCSGSIKILSGNSNPELAKFIAEKLGVKQLVANIQKFSDGEISVELSDTVRGHDVFIVQSTSAPANDNLMELLILIDTVKRASAGRINVVMPYYGYARQDRKDKPRVPISAKLVANMIMVAGANRLITMDLHCQQIQGFFDIPVDHLVGYPLFLNYYKDKFADADNLVVVGPDFGSAKKSDYFAEDLGASVALIDKKRARANESRVRHFVGEVEGKIAIILDDMCDTGGTLINAVDEVLHRGALEVHVCCTHGVLSGSAIERIEKSNITEMVVLDTIAPKKLNTNKIKYLSVAEDFKNAIESVHNESTVSAALSYNRYV